VGEEVAAAVVVKGEVGKRGPGRLIGAVVSSAAGRGCP